MKKLRWLAVLVVVHIMCAITALASTDLSEIPVYQGFPYVDIQGGVPGFTADEITTAAFESYSDLDWLGRCGVAFACVGQEIMPTEERGEIGQIKPTGWHTVRYDDLIEDHYLYNRCHLVAYCLAGENANEKNLITGTRYLNVTGMLPNEIVVANYVQNTGNHVLYRVTPLYDGNNLVANGVQMEAYSVEDDGAGVCFNLFCYNVQPGIGIDYASGDSWTTEDGSTYYYSSYSGAVSVPVVTGATVQGTESSSVEYVVNTNTGKFHSPTCDSVSQMSEKNKMESSQTRDELIAQGYSPCHNCNP